MRQQRRELHHGRLVSCYADRPANVAAMLDTRFAEAADRLAVVDGAARVTYKEVARRSASVAAALAARGVQSGDRVAVMLENGLDAVLAMAAIARLGAVLVPVGTRLRAPEIAFMAGDAEPSVVIHAPPLAGELAFAGLAGTACLETASAEWRGAGAALPPALPAETADEDDLFAILYTSGTTGRPKGAKLTHLNVVHSCLHWQEVHHLGPDERTLFCIPWSHVAGLCGVLLPFLHAGGTIVMAPGFKRQTCLELLQVERITHALMVPAMYGLLLLVPGLAQAALSSWRIGAFGGAPMPDPTIARFGAILPHLQMRDCYGATETASPVTITRLGEHAGRAGSVGQAVPCGELVIMDDDGHEVSAGQEGEIWIGGPMVVPGYWRRPDADREAFAGGFWKSGDIGSLDAEGYLRIAGRKKEMINRGGFKVYPAEVECALAGLPGVTEAAVIGQPDPVLGETVVAILCVEADGLTGEQVRAWCASRMADYKVPGTVVIGRTPLPRNANGKLQRAELRASLARANLAESAS